MIFERMVFGMAKNLNLFGDFDFVESSNGTFKTYGRREILNIFNSLTKARSTQSKINLNLIAHSPLLYSLCSWWLSEKNS